MNSRNTLCSHGFFPVVNMMHNKIIKMLEYPGYVLRGNILLIGCEEQGVFNASQSHCEYCPDSQACKWLKEVDETSDAGELKHNDLVEHLEFALDRMIAHVHVLGHNIFTCSCEDCEWIQDALELYEKTQMHQ